MNEQHAPGRQLLEGIKVLDLSRAIAGPYCAMLLGDLGATVVKVEPPGYDMARMAGISRVGEQSTYFVAMNRNKQSIVLDLKTAEGREVFQRLIKWADVMLENFRAGVLEKLGFGHERLTEVNPNLLVCSVSGYGQTAPIRGRKALDLIGQTMSGLASVTGDPGGPPTPAGAPVSDVLTGLNACIGVLAGLVARGRMGEQFPYTAIDVSLVASTLGAMAVEATSYLNTGKVPQRHGGAWFELFPYDVFPTANGWIAIGAADWSTLCTLLGLEDLARREDLLDMQTRLRERPQLKKRFSEATIQKSTDEWLAILQAADILSGPVYTLGEALEDDTLRPPLAIDLHHPMAGDSRTIDSAPVFWRGAPGGETWPKSRSAPPLPGEHTLEVLAQLGYDDTEIERLCREDVVAFLAPLEHDTAAVPNASGRR